MEHYNTSGERREERAQHTSHLVGRSVCVVSSSLFSLLSDRPNLLYTGLSLDPFIRSPDGRMD